jgi:hypothetical protein
VKIAGSNHAKPQRRPSSQNWNLSTHELYLHDKIKTLRKIKESLKTITT